MDQGTPKLYLQPKTFTKTPEMCNCLCYISTSKVNRDFKLNMTQAVLLIFSISRPALLTALPNPSWWQCLPSVEQDKPLEPLFSFFFLLHLTSISQEALLIQPWKGIQISTILHRLHPTILQTIIISCFQYPLSSFPFFPPTHSIDYSHYRN